MRTRTRVAQVAAVVLVAGFVASRTLLKPEPIEVDAVRVERGAVEDLVTNSEAGTVRAREHARLAAERAGRVLEIPRREGAAVRRGEVLVRLDASTAASQLEAARRDAQALDAVHQTAHAALELARRAHERARELGARSLIAPERMEEASTALESAEAELRAAEARLLGARSAVRLAEDEVAHRVVRAPFDGVVSRRHVEIGESVVPGQPVLDVTDLTRLYVSAPIDERDAGRLRIALPARITVDAHGTAVWRGVVTRLASLVEETEDRNRTLEVEVELDAGRPAAGPALRPGMTADVEIVLDRRDGVLRVPAAAVIEGGRVLLAERGRVAARAIVTGLRNWQWTEVRDGLAGGELVITSLDRPGVAPGAAVAVKVAPPGGALADTATVALR